MERRNVEEYLRFGAWATKSAIKWPGVCSSSGQEEGRVTVKRSRSEHIQSATPIRPWNKNVRQTNIRIGVLRNYQFCWIKKKKNHTNLLPPFLNFPSWIHYNEGFRTILQSYGKAPLACMALAFLGWLGTSLTKAGTELTWFKTCPRSPSQPGKTVYCIRPGVCLASQCL